MERVERVLGLVVLLELDETVAFRQLGAKVQRDDDFDNVTEPAELILEVFLPLKIVE